MTNPKQIAGEERTLLEMAARAAGIKIEWVRNPAYIQERWEAMVPCGWVGQPTQCEWNPIRENGDAFGLAVKLRMCVDCVTGADVVEYYCDDRIQFAEIDITADDYMASVRLAIVRAAASIGASMKEEQA